MYISFSIIITFYEDNIYLTKCLDKLNTILSPKQIDFEVILISEKKYTIKKIYKYDLHFLHSLNIKNPGKKRNIAAKFSKNSILVFLDDDAYPSKNWLITAYKFFLNKKINYCLGGPGIIPKDDNYFSQLSNLFLCSKIFYPFRERYISVQNKNKKKFTDWPSVNFFIPKKLFWSVGGFDETYWPGEDSKLCNKLFIKKKLIIYLSKLVVYHYRRSSLILHIKQFFRYGYNRMTFYLNGDANSSEFIFFVPLLFIFYIFFLLFFQNSLIILLPLYIYILLLFIDIFFVNEISKKKVDVVLFSRFVIIISHIAYGFGSFLSLLNYLFSREYKTKLKR
jgi:GT2 family glycosyltransferase